MSSENKVELKPCPFCGGVAHLIRNWDSPFIAIKCEDCDCKTSLCYNDKNAIRIWNNRVSK